MLNPVKIGSLSMTYRFAVRKFVVDANMEQFTIVINIYIG